MRYGAARAHCRRGRETPLFFQRRQNAYSRNQGHSIPVDVDLAKLAPPAVLYHGTGKKFAAQIDFQGLIPKSRLYVHLSTDFETARKVGARHGSPVVYRVESGRMNDEGFSFYLSANGVWLTKNVPVGFLEKVDGA